MRKLRNILPILLVILTNITHSNGQEMIIDEMYRIELLIQMEKYESAIKFTKALNDSLECPKNEILGFSYMKLGKYDLAVKHYEKYIKDCDPSSIQRINLGDNYFKTNQFIKAKEQFSKIGAGDFNYSLAQYNLGMIEYTSGEKIKAINYFTSAINNPNGEAFDFDYLEMLIKTLNETKEYEKGFKNLETVLNIWDKSSDEYLYTLILRASIYGAMDNYKKAIKEIDSVIDLGIDNNVILFEAYAHQIEYYAKINDTKMVCSLYKKIQEINPETNILTDYSCAH